MRARRTCGGKNYADDGTATMCPHLAAVGRTLCDEHEKAYEAKRGSASQRGYDARHRRWAASAKRRAVGTPCVLCGVVMVSSDDLEAEHSTPLATDRASRADRIVHARCNPRGGAGMRS